MRNSKIQMVLGCIGGCIIKKTRLFLISQIYKNETSGHLFMIPRVILVCAAKSIPGQKEMFIHHHWDEY